jgi:hypothetical protein
MNIQLTTDYQNQRFNFLKTFEGDMVNAYRNAGIRKF